MMNTAATLVPFHLHLISVTPSKMKSDKYKSIKNNLTIDDAYIVQMMEIREAVNDASDSQTLEKIQSQVLISL